MNEKPLVSVCMITYNHEKYIAQAIEGVLMQKTDFPVELVIGEDCSTDSTRDICLDYERVYPHRVRVLPNSENLGIVANFRRTLSSARAEYVALCEGDDYWTYPQKLLEQVTFLQHNPVYSGVCSDVLIFNESTNSFKAQSLYLDTKQVQDFDFDLVLHDTMVHLPTLLFRKELIDVSLFRTNHLFADLSTTLMLLDKGPIQFWKRPDVVYRLHSGGITRTTKYCKFYEQIIEFLDDLNEHTNFRHNESIEERKQLLKAMIKIGGESRNPFKKLSGMYSYLRHDRKSVTSKEIKSIIGLAFPRVISRFRRSG